MIRFRHATAVDVPSLLGLWEVAAENDSRPTDTAEKIETMLRRDREACLVAEQTGEIVGSVIAGWDGWRAHIYRLAVHPEMRRQGIGSRLLEQAEKRLCDLGATRVDAMVLDHNELGQILWQTSGYARQQEWRRWVLPL